MKKIILFICLLPILNAFGQDSLRGTYFGVSIYPNYATGFVFEDQKDDTYYTGVRSGILAYSLGFKISYQFTNNTIISSGLYLMRTGDESKIFPPDPYKGFYAGRYYRHIEKYIEVPIQFSYKIKRKWLFTIGGSFAYNYSHVNQIYLGKSLPIKLDIDEFENTAFGAIANIGFGYSVELTEKRFLEILPFAQFNFINTMQGYGFADYHPKRNIGSIGLQLNYLMKAKK